MCTEGTSTQGPRGDGFPLRGRAFSRRDGRVWVDRALGPQSQSVPGPPWSPVALNTSGSSCTHLAPLPHHWLWCQALQRRGGGQRPDLLWQSWVLSGVAPAGACLCGVSGGGRRTSGGPQHGVGGPPLPTCARRHLWTHLSRSGLWTGPGLALLEAARPTLAIALRQILTRGSRRDLCRTGTCLTVRRAGEWRVSDSALDCWTVARASPRLAVDRQAGLYVLGARVH